LLRCPIWKLTPAGASNENPLDFKSTDFKFTKEAEKGGWLVTIKPNSKFNP
jgi:hypothetical protein